MQAVAGFYALQPAWLPAEETEQSSLQTLNYWLGGATVLRPSSTSQASHGGTQAAQTTSAAGQLRPDPWVLSRHATRVGCSSEDKQLLATMHPRQVCGHHKQRQGSVDILMPAVLQAKSLSLQTLRLYVVAGIHNISAHKRPHNLSALKRLRWQRSRLTSWRCIVRRPLRKMGMSLPSQVGRLRQNGVLFAKNANGPSSSIQGCVPVRQAGWRCHSAARRAPLSHHTTQPAELPSCRP